MSKHCLVLLVLAPLAGAQDPIFLTPYTPIGKQIIFASAGDLNGDGRSDLLLTRLSGSFDLHLGLGDGAFAPAQALSTSAGTHRTLLLDADLDGALDIAGCIDVASPDFVSVRRGHGDGTFFSPQFFDVNPGPQDLDAGDLDQDGAPDIAVACNTTFRVSVMYGVGDGNFTLADVAASAPTGAIAVGELDGDGDLDLAVCMDLGGAQPLLGNGRGGFTAGPMIAVNNPSDIELGDMDGDGDEDVGISRIASSQAFALTSGGAFGPPTLMPASSVSGLVFMPDLDEDGHADLVYDTKGIDVVLSHGDGTVAPLQRIGTSNGSVGIAIDDFDGDGDLDLFTPGAGIPFAKLQYTGTLLRGDGAGHFGPLLGAPTDLDQLDAGDLDGDGLLELVVAGGGPQGLLVYEGVDHGVFSCAVHAFDIGEPISVRAVALGDMDEDGALDVVAAMAGAVGSFSLFRGGGDLTLGTPELFGSQLGSKDVVVSDLDLDGHLDVAAAAIPGFVELLRGDGTGAFAVSDAEPTLAAGPVALVAADMQGDGLPDLVALNDGVAFVQVYLSEGGGQIAQGLAFATETSVGRGLAAGDVDGDGDVDVACTTASFTTVLLNDGAGSLSKLPPALAAAHAHGVAIADVSRDGLADLVLSMISELPEINGNHASIQVLVGHGDGSFDAPLIFPMSVLGQGLLVRDLDGDEVPDAAAATQNDDVAVYLNQRGPWDNLGHALAGVQGLPRQRGFGAMHPGSPFEFRLTDARPGGSAWHVIGLSELNAPFKGGVCVPAPLLTTGPWPLDAHGDLSLQGPWPGPSAPGVQLFFQFWQQDPAAVKGWSASTALRLTLP